MNVELFLTYTELVQYRSRNHIIKYDKQLLLIF